MTKKKANSKSKKQKSDTSTLFFKSVSSYFKNQQTQTILGVFCVFFAIFLTIAFASFFFSWQEDQSLLAEFGNKNQQTKNLLKQTGAVLGNFFVYEGFGLGAFMIPFLFLITGLAFLLQTTKRGVVVSWNWGLLIMLWVSVALGFFNKELALLSGTIGFELNEYLQIFIGKIGLIILLTFFLIVFLIVKFGLTSASIIQKMEENKKTEEEKTTEDNSSASSTEEKSEFELTLDNLKSIVKDRSKATPTLEVEKNDKEEGLEIDVEKIAEEKSVSQNLSEKLVQDFGEFDPKLELAEYRFPTFNLLKQYNESISINQEELELNKNQIVETLKNYGIGIDKIKATVGPTITLYEIVPQAGVRISKIKNLEDDIALSLSALGIRIIAPIPGKGTIGIEVPNKKSTIVSMHSVITSKKFQESAMQLPIAIGKTISNETFVVDLAKMPHLLMAGATGQGKSVGLNAILTSLLYRKHPAEVKFVLVDPKKVELTLFNKIERHYLAKLPEEEEAIITDTSKVVNTLNSLCIEMDNRYDLLKDALVRNIKEYNQKFKERKLNPENGHQFLPYIVLVIDEFADLIMTAGKEVETPIARLAQLARAVGIHLIVATQRPSVNVITGIIKANFPARVAFRVTSKIDSRTILDAPGADQLIGRGDMLYSGGSDLTRIQCAFVDTPEIEKITDFIGSQRAYPDAYLLPEYIGEDGGTNLDVDIADRDKLFKDAAEVIVIAQQGSASLLQRKLKLGYNRAGRIIDQLEVAGIVGPFEGSKARQVLVPDLIALEQLLENEKK